jgi:hypothetical protein
MAGVVVAAATTFFQQSPGYMDAAYYTVTGAQIAQSKGMTEPFLWNYLDNPAGLPHAAFTYWMPFPALLAALGFFLSGSSSFIFARIPFIFLAGFVPVITARLTYQMTGRTATSSIAGWMAVFPIFYMPYLAMPDSFLALMVCGGILGLCLLRIFSSEGPIPFFTWFITGLCCGVINLCRADGLLWITIIGFVALIWILRWQKSSFKNVTLAMVGLFTGFFVVFGWWYIRNMVLFGQFFSPASQYPLWFTTYDQLFNQPVGQINIHTWLASGIHAIVAARWSAIKMNLATMLGVQTCVFLLPFIIIGSWKEKHKITNIVFFGLYGLLFLVMSLAFPFAGSRGGFFHSGAVFQPWLWAVAAIGFQRTIEWVSPRRKWDANRAFQGFRIILIVVLALSTFTVYYIQVMGVRGSVTVQNETLSSSNIWDSDFTTYQNIDQFLEEQGIFAEDIVMVNDPPLFYWATTQSSIIVPNGTPEEVFQTALQYSADYLVIEPEHVLGLNEMYDGINGFPWFDYLGTVNGSQIYRINP